MQCKLGLPLLRRHRKSQHNSRLLRAKIIDSRWLYRKTMIKRLQSWFKCRLLQGPTWKALEVLLEVQEGAVGIVYKSSTSLKRHSLRLNNRIFPQVPERLSRWHLLCKMTTVDRASKTQPAKAILQITMTRVIRCTSIAQDRSNLSQLHKVWTLQQIRGRP